jgi:hypothetical protein
MMCQLFIKKKWNFFFSFQILFTFQTLPPALEHHHNMKQVLFFLLSLNQKLIRLIFYWPTSSILLPSQKEHHNTGGNFIFIFFAFFRKFIRLVSLLEREISQSHEQFFFYSFIRNLFGWFLFWPKVSCALSFRGPA